MSKVLVVDYCAEAIFKIPKHIDLEDKTQVEGYWVKWQVLYIRLVGVQELMEIQPCREADIDTKYGSNARIQDADDWGISDDEEEEEEEQEEVKSPPSVVYDICGVTGGKCRKFDGCQKSVDAGDTCMIDNTSFCVPCYEKWDEENEEEEEDDDEEHDGVCRECNKPTVHIDDWLCHSCYHATCDEGECYCDEHSCQSKIESLYGIPYGCSNAKPDLSS